MSEDSKSIMSLDEFIDIDEFVAEIESDVDDLHQSLTTQPARLAYYGLYKTRAKRQRDRVSNYVRSIEAKLKKEYREKLTEEAAKLADEEGTKPQRISNDMVEAEVYTDQRMLKLLEVELKAKEIYETCDVARDAYRQRCEMIKSLSILTGQEMRMGISQEIRKSKKRTVEDYKNRRKNRGGGDMVGQSAD